MPSGIDTAISAADAFFHVRIINGIGISLCLSRILVFASRFVQHPKKYKISYLHTGWLSVVFFWIIFFWWSYLFRGESKNYNLYIYMLELLYVFGLFFVCVTLTPDDISEYGNYENYFLARKNSLFSLFIFLNMAQSLDEIGLNTVTGNHDMYYINISNFLAQTAVLLIAMRINNRAVQYIFITSIIGLTIWDFAS